MSMYACICTYICSSVPNSRIQLLETALIGFRFTPRFMNKETYTNLEILLETVLPRPKYIPARQKHTGSSDVQQGS